MKYVVFFLVYATSIVATANHPSQHQIDISEMQLSSEYNREDVIAAIVAANHNTVEVKIFEIEQLSVVRKGSGVGAYLALVVEEEIVAKWSAYSSFCWSGCLDGFQKKFTHEFNNYKNEKSFRDFALLLDPNDNTVREIIAIK